MYGLYALSGLIVLIAALMLSVWLRQAAEHRRTETALRTSLARYRSLFNNAPVGLYRTTPAGQIIEANPALARLLGCPDVETLLNLDVYQFYEDAEQRQRWQAAVEQQAAIHQFEGRLRQLDGTLIWVRGTAQVVRDEQGRPLYYEGALQDVTEHKRVEVQMREMARRHATLYHVLVAISGQLNAASIARAAVEAIVEFTQWAHVSIALLDPDRTHWSVQAVSGLLAQAPPTRRPISEGIIGRALRSGNKQVVADVSADPDYVAGHPAIRSELVVPLQRGRRIMGALDIESDQPAAFRDGDVMLAESLAEAIALGLDNARFYAEARQQAADLSALYAITRTTSRSLALDDVLSQALSSAMMLLGFDVGLIALANRPGEPLRLALQRGMPPDYIDFIQRQGIENTLCHYVYTQRFTMAISDFEQEGRTGAVQTIDQMIAMGWRAYVGIPLIHQEQALGVMSLFSTQPRPASTYNLALLTTIGHQIATAIENARLFSATLNQRSHLTAIVRSSRDGIVLINTEGRILVINEPALHMLHLPGQTEEWVERRLTDAMRVLHLFAPSIVPVMRREARRIRRGDNAPSEGEYKAPPHTIHWLNLPVSTGSKPLGRLLVLRDVSSERTVEQLRDDLIHTMVHDLRNPLSVLVSALDLIGSGIAYKLDATQSNLIGIAQEASQRITNLVNAILDVNRLESGQMPVEYQAFSLASLVDQLIQTQTLPANAKTIRLENNVPPTLPPAWADPHLVERVLQNLVGNAIKFTPAGGVVRITATLLEQEGQSQLVVSVSDTGGGIPASVQSRLFQKFAAGSQSERGSGLGLAFCKLALEAHGQRIWGCNNPDQGATFSFTLATPPPVV